jgi:pimeloyl-ACP methyl ester carboxylesterase
LGNPLVVKHAPFRQGRLHFTDQGQGRAVVLLHGFLEDSSIWQELATDLSKGYRVIAIDLPGHGQSDSYGYIHEMEMMAKGVKEVLDFLGLWRVAIIGHSMGGYVALAFAEQFPEMLRGMVLFHSTALPDSPERKQERDRAIAAIKHNHGKFIAGSLHRLFHPEWAGYHAPQIEALEARASRMSARGIIDSLEGMKCRKNREMILQAAAYPIQFIAGQADPVVPIEDVKAQCQLPKRSVLTVLQHSAHMGFLEEPEQSKKAIRRFLRMAFRMGN